MTMGIGIIGCGNISTTYLGLAPLFRGLQVVAVADMNMAAAQARAAEYGVDAQTVDALLANPQVGLVINLTIPDAHYAISRRAVEAGKHVYSEKPLVLTLADGVALRDLAHQGQIAQRHGGQVSCLSRDGGGSCFELRLPGARGDQPGP